VRALLAVAAFAALLGAARPAVAQLGTVADVLIRGGHVVDGSGEPARRADVAVVRDRIVLVGDAARAGVTGRRTIDAAGLVVAPGFIDPHTHTLEDLSDTARRANLPYLMQGVTTVITGNDGGGPVETGAVLARWDRQGLGTNAALLVGHGAVRRRVLGMADTAPSPAQLDSMRALVVLGMRGGALGLSTGLYYAPGSYASTEEVIELAKVAARRGGLYDSHLRDEDSYSIGLLAAVGEAIRIARAARLPVNISHIKALGRDVWGKSDSVVALIRRARAEGLEVTADQYPYAASGSTIGASLLPRWAEAGGQDSLLARMADPVARARLIADMTTNLRRRGGAGSLLITTSRDSALVGKTLQAVAAARGVPPVDAALDILRTGDAGVASFNMSEADIRTFMRQDFVATSSDGSSGHPRKYGTFPRKLREYVYVQRVIDLPFAVRTSSALTAQTFRLVRRGLLRDGYYADIVVFDPTALADRATYDRPERLATGVRYVLVNGALAVDGGRYTGRLAGRTLRGAQAAASASDLSPPVAPGRRMR
jgi:N-acyl-D-amino-acid deacylase